MVTRDLNKTFGVCDIFIASASYITYSEFIPLKVVLRANLSAEYPMTPLNI